MSDFCNPYQLRIARKVHRCTYCAELIDAGDQYVYQTGVYEARWYTSKMHPECFNDMSDSGDNEYTPYYNERPQREETK